MQQLRSKTIGLENISKCLSWAVQLEPSSHSIVLCDHMYGFAYSCKYFIVQCDFRSCEPRQA